eukprot:gene9618-10633_t
MENNTKHFQCHVCVANKLPFEIRCALPPSCHSLRRGEAFLHQVSEEAVVVRQLHHPLVNQRNINCQIITRSKMPEFNLTSRVINSVDNGIYPFYDAELLYSHEALRREIDHAQEALRNFDITVHPWKVFVFNRWLVRFFIPVLKLHYEIQDTIVYPFYLDLGAILPEEAAAQHAAVLSGLQPVTEKVDETIKLVKGNHLYEASLLARELSGDFDRWAATALDLFAKEEGAWPAVYQKFGQSTLDKVTSKVVFKGLQNKDYQVYLASILNAAGYQLRGYPLLAFEKAWTGAALQDRFLFTLPNFVRVGLLPVWNKRYHTYKSLIISVTGDVDKFRIQEEPEFYKVQCPLY